MVFVQISDHILLWGKSKLYISFQMSYIFNKHTIFGYMSTYCSWNSGRFSSNCIKERETCCNLVLVISTTLLLTRICWWICIVWIVLYTTCRNCGHLSTVRRDNEGSPWWPCRTWRHGVTQVWYASPESAMPLTGLPSGFSQPDISSVYLWCWWHGTKMEPLNSMSK